MKIRMVRFYISKSGVGEGVIAAFNWFWKEEKGCWPREKHVAPTRVKRRSEANPWLKGTVGFLLHSLNLSDAYMNLVETWERHLWSTLLFVSFPHLSWEHVMMMKRTIHVTPPLSKAFLYFYYWVFKSEKEGVIWHTSEETWVKPDLKT